MKLCCIGDLCADLLLPYGEVKQHLRNLKQGAVDYSEVLFRHGGTCGNTCTVLAKLGEEPYFVTDLCGDNIGRYLSQSMREYGVNLSWSKGNPAKANMICIAVIEENNERVMFPWLPPGGDYPIFSNDNLSLIPEDEPMLVFTGGMVMNNDPDSMNAVCEKVERLKKNGSTVVFDLNVRAETYGMSAERKAAYDRMIAASDIIIGSGVEEFAAVTGALSLEAAVDQLSELCQAVIARDGKKPVLVGQKTRRTYVPTEAVFVWQTIGAGDTFNAAFLYAIHHHLSIEQAVAFANGIAGYMISSSEHLAVPNDIEERITHACMKYDS
ncbi:MAG: carbohydrate kinase family protein [Solobacterium sp.]|nr:carbohydrate kinase family protein [Solobacterium sp.]